MTSPAIQTAEMSRERREKEPRKPLTRRQYLQLCLDQEGKCGCGCGVKLDAMREGVIDEHLIPLGLTGGNELTNRALYRKPCAAAKTKPDRKQIAKGNRQAKMDEPREPSRLQGRGFSKAKRPFPKSRGFEKRRAP